MEELGHLLENLQSQSRQLETTITNLAQNFTAAAEAETRIESAPTTEASEIEPEPESEDSPFPSQNAAGVECLEMNLRWMIMIAWASLTDSKNAPRGCQRSRFRSANCKRRFSGGKSSLESSQVVDEDWDEVLMTTKTLSLCPMKHHLLTKIGMIGRKKTMLNCRSNYQKRNENDSKRWRAARKNSNEGRQQQLQNQKVRKSIFQ